MVERDYKPVVPAGGRYTLTDGTLRTRENTQPFSTTAAKAADGSMRPLIGIFPDMSYYGFLLVGALAPVVNYGFSDDGINVVQQNRVWLNEQTTNTYPAHTPQQISAKRIYFDNGYVFASPLWLKSMPLVQAGYSGGFRDFYLPAKSYAHVEQKMYCLRDYDSDGNPKILGFMQGFKRDVGDEFRYKSYKCRVQGQILNSLYNHNYNPYPISYLDSAYLTDSLWPYDADGNYKEYQSTIAPALNLSNYIDNNHSFDYKIVGPSYYQESWQYRLDYKASIKLPSLSR